MPTTLPEILVRATCLVLGHRWAVGSLEASSATSSDDEQTWACTRCGLIEIDANLDVLIADGRRDTPGTTQLTG